MQLDLFQQQNDCRIMRTLSYHQNEKLELLSNIRMPYVTLIFYPDQKKLRVDIHDLGAVQAADLCMRARDSLGLGLAAAEINGGDSSTVVYAAVFYHRLVNQLDITICNLTVPGAETLFDEARKTIFHDFGLTADIPEESNAVPSRN